MALTASTPPAFFASKSSCSYSTEKGMDVPPPCSLTHSAIFGSHLLFLAMKFFFERLMR